MNKKPTGFILRYKRITKIGRPMDSFSVFFVH